MRYKPKSEALPTMDTKPAFQPQPGVVAKVTPHMRAEQEAKLQPKVEVTEMLKTPAIGTKRIYGLETIKKD